jgi:hypothetical protein
MIVLLLEDVTLLEAEQIIVQARFRGGATTTLRLPLPLNAWQGRKTPIHKSWHLAIGIDFLNGLAGFPVKYVQNQLKK